MLKIKENETIRGKATVESIFKGYILWWIHFRIKLSCIDVRVKEDSK